MYGMDGREFFILFTGQVDQPIVGADGITGIYEDIEAAREVVRQIARSIQWWQIVRVTPTSRLAMAYTVAQEGGIAL